MADYPGDAEARGRVDIMVPHPGKSTGLTVPPPATLRPDFNIGALSIPYDGADDYQFVDSSVSPPASVDRPAEMVTASPGMDWFEAVHLMPRDGVDFGNIITDVTERFEIFNAFRHQSVSLLSITNNALPGTELPDMPTPPDSLGPLESYLDPTSTTLNPIKQIVKALAEGLTSFDKTIDFAFNLGVGTLKLRVIGTRIVLLPVNFNMGLRETLSFKTDIIEVKSGKEQRISLRENPRQILEGQLHLEGAERQHIQALLFSWQPKIMAVMAWPEQMKITQDITGGAGATANVDSTNYVDLRVGSLAAVFKDYLTFDVLTVQSTTATSVTFDSDIQESYDVGDFVVPVRLAYVQGFVRGRKKPVNVELLNLRCVVIDNDTGAPTGDTTPFNTYNSKVLLDGCNFLNGDLPEEYQQKVYTIDNETGLVTQESPWDKNKRIHRKGFSTHSRQELFEVRRLLYALRGRQVSFYIPTFYDDLTVSQNLSAGSDKMRISWIGYTRFIDNTEPKATFKITFTDGTSLVRNITASSQVSGTEEELTLNTIWPSAKTIAEIESVTFYEKVRINTDDIQIDHSSIVGRARIFFPVKVVFD